MRFSWKKLLLVGIILIVLGFAVFVTLEFVPKLEAVNQQTFDLTTKPSYFSEPFHGERGDSLDLDITTSGQSEVVIRGQVVGEVFRVGGTRYQYSYPISKGDVYQMEIRNMVGHWEDIFTWVLDDNHFSGSLYFRRTAFYVLPLTVLGFALIIIGGVAIPLGVYGILVEKRKARMSRVCPQCRQTVSIERTVCPHCGFDITKSVRCKFCDALYDSSLIRCPNCGAKKQ